MQAFPSFIDVIRNLTDAELVDPSAHARKLTIAADGPIEVQYAPFEHVNPHARVVIVGITLGRTQMVNALLEYRRQLLVGESADSALAAAKQVGAFSGQMRNNLVALMDAIGLNTWLGLSSCADLFGHASHLVQTTSLLRNPVFVKGKNYNGTPSMLRHLMLRTQLLDGFSREARAMPKSCFFLPLGDTVAKPLHWLADQGVIERSRILDCLPHPSPANGERISYFLGRKPSSELSIKTKPHKFDQAKMRLTGRLMSA